MTAPNRFIPFFILSFHVFIYWVLVGHAPIDPVDDYAHIVLAAESPWTHMLHAFVTWNPLRDIIHDNGALHHAFGSRAGNTLILKFAYTLFGEWTFGYYLLQFLTSGVCVVLIYYSAMRLTHSVGFSVFSALSFSLLPPAFIHNIWVSDPSEMVHLCLLTVFLLSMDLHRTAATGGWNQKRLFWIKSAGLLLVGYFALKTKPNGYMVILLPLAYLFLKCLLSSKLPQHKIGRIAFILIAGLGLAVYLGLPRVLPQNILMMTFQNHPGQWGPEESFALFDMGSVLPVSLFRNMGFFLGWAALISCLCLAISKVRPRRFETRVLLLWLGLEILFFGMARNEPRYLTDSLIPLVLLLPVLFQTMRHYLISPFFKKTFTSLLIIGVSFNLIYNFQHMKFLSRWKIGSYSTLLKPIEVIYNDSRNRPAGFPVGFAEFLRFFRPEEIGETKSARGYEDLIAFSHNPSIGLKPYEQLEARRMIQSYGSAYGIGFSEHSRAEGFRLLETIDPETPSPFTKMRGALGMKNKSSGKVYIHKASKML